MASWDSSYKMCVNKVSLVQHLLVNQTVDVYDVVGAKMIVLYLFESFVKKL